MTLTQRVRELVEQHGSLRAAARAIQLDVGYMSRLASGEKKCPKDSALRKLGLRAVTIYAKNKPGT